MKHISTKLILLTMILVASLIAVNAFMSIQILKKESRAYTFQTEQLQTQSYAKQFENEFSRAEEIAAKVFSLQITEDKLLPTLENIFKDVERPSSLIQGVGIWGKQGLKKQWYETHGERISKGFKIENDWIDKIKAVNLVRGSTPTDVLVLFPSENAVVAVEMSFEKIRNDCASSSVAFYSQSGSPILFCNDQVETRIRSLPGSLQQALVSTFQTGSFEKSENNFVGLWAYSAIGAWGKVVSVADTVTAYRPAYILGLQIALLALLSIGLAIAASIIVAKKVTDPITLISEATQKIANGDFDAPIEVNTQDETKILAESVKGMAQKIKKLIESEIEKTKIEGQLEIAGALQRLFIPKSEIDFDRYHISSMYLPADQCGGDWWGFVKCEKQLALFIGDVTGHGYASAMLVATTRGYLAMLQNEVNCTGSIQHNPGELLKILNTVVMECTASELNMTAFCIVLDLESGQFQYSSAGHNPSYLLSASKNEIRSLSVSGYRLGDTADIDGDFEVLDGKLESASDRLVLFTDGIQDLGVGQETLKRKGFRNFLERHLGKTGIELVTEVKNELIPLNQGAHLEDDVTFLVLERRNDEIR